MPANRPRDRVKATMSAPTAPVVAPWTPPPHWTNTAPASAPSVNWSSMIARRPFSVRIIIMISLSCRPAWNPKLPEPMP